MKVAAKIENQERVDNDNEVTSFLAKQAMKTVSRLDTKAIFTDITIRNVRPGSLLLSGDENLYSP